MREGMSSIPEGGDGEGATSHSSRRTTMSQLARCYGGRDGRGQMAPSVEMVPDFNRARDLTGVL